MLRKGGRAETRMSWAGSWWVGQRQPQIWEKTMASRLCCPRYCLGDHALIRHTMGRRPGHWAVCDMEDCRADRHQKSIRHRPMHEEIMGISCLMQRSQQDWCFMDLLCVPVSLARGEEDGSIMLKSGQILNTSMLSPVIQQRHCLAYLGKTGVDISSCF